MVMASANDDVPPMEGTSVPGKNRTKKRKLPYRTSEFSLSKRRYRGRLSSRANLGFKPSPFELRGVDDVVSNSGDEGIDNEEIESESYEDAENNEDRNEDERDAEDGRMKTTMETEEERLNREVAELEREEKEAAKQLVRIRKDDIRKGEAVMKQMALYDSILNLRIRMQPMLNSAMRIPRPGFLEDYSQLSSKLSKTSEAVQSLLDGLEKAQNSVIASSGVLEKKATDEEDESNDGSSDDESDDKEENVKGGTIERTMRDIMAWKDPEVDKWGRRVDEATGRGLAVKSKFKAVDLSISGQIRHTLKDKERLLRRTRRIRGKVEVIGSGEVEEEEDDEHFCDADFYQRLLRDVIEQGEGGMQKMISLRRRNRKKKDVDRKASKGRKLKYVVHEKLVGFLAPVALKESPAVDELVKGMFGKRPNAPQKESGKK